VNVSVYQSPDIPFLYHPSFFPQPHFSSQGAQQRPKELEIHDTERLCLNSREIDLSSASNYPNPCNITKRIHEIANSEVASQNQIARSSRHPLQVQYKEKRKLKSKNVFKIERQEKSDEESKNDLKISKALPIDGNNILNEAKNNQAQMHEPSDNSGENRIEESREERKRCARKLTKAEKLARKNRDVEAFRFRNVYKFILKHLYNYTRDKTRAIKTNLGAKNHTEREINIALDKILSLRSTISASGTIQEARKKIDSLLSGNTCTLLIFIQALNWMLQGFIRTEFIQINLKNKGTYMDCCKLYLKRAEEKLDISRKQ